MANISVIIPCYNVESYIDRCLTSITSQTIDLSFLEIICVDDASTDNTWKLLQKWEELYPNNIMIVHCEINRRQGTARNIGLQYSTSPWVAFIDADDWVELDYFEKMYQASMRLGVDMITCGHIRDFSQELSFLDRSDSKEDQLLFLDSEEKRKLYIRMMSSDLTAWGKLIRKEILVDNEIYFPEDLAYEDNYWGTLLHFYINKIYKINTPLYHYYVNSDSTILKMNADYHIDFLTVQLLKLEEFRNRGFYQQYKQEIDFDFLHSCYLDFLKIICLRYNPPAYNLFLLLKETILDSVPDYKNNIYLQNGFTEFQHMLIDLISMSINRKQFLEIAKHVKHIGI